MKGSRKKILLAGIVALSVAALPVLAGCEPKETAETAATLVKQTFYDTQEVQSVQVGDITMAYKSFGAGEPLVMITGFSTTMDTWDPNFLEALAATSNVIVFDNRGMGKTTDGTATFTIDQFADDTAGLITALGFDQANVLGWSIGGDIALSLVVNHPDVVDKLVSYAGDCGGPQMIPSVEYEEVLQDLQAQEVDATGSLALAELFPGWYMEANPDYWETFPWPTELSGPDSIKKQLDAYNSWAGVYDMLPSISRPVLIATGTLDVSTPPGNADILASRIPGNKYVRFEGAGHGLQYMYPYDFAYAIREFLAQ